MHLDWLDNPTKEKKKEKKSSLCAYELRKYNIKLHKIILKKNKHI